MKILLLGLLLFPAAASAVDLLNMPPPCPAPADVAASSADFDPAKEASLGIVPADITPRRPVDLDVPLYLPQSSVSGSAVASAGSSTSGTSSTVAPNAVETAIPIGGVAIRNDKVVSVQALGQENLGGAAGADSRSTGCRAR